MVPSSRPERRAAWQRGRPGLQEQRGQWDQWLPHCFDLETFSCGFGGPVGAAVVSGACLGCGSICRSTVFSFPFPGLFLWSSSSDSLSCTESFF